MQGILGKSLRVLGLSLLLAVALAAPSRAGIYYQSVTTGDQPKQEVRVRGWVDGAKAKIEFEQKGSSPIPNGAYLLTQDGGQTLYLVDPKKQTYSRWDLEQMLKTVGSVMEAMGPMMSLEITDPKVQKLGEESGGTIAGLPTTLLRYRTTYGLEMKIMGMRRSQQVEQVQEIWATRAVEDPGLGIWLRKGRPTGWDSLDKLIAAEMDKASGFPLKMVTLTTTTTGKGKQQKTRTEMVVSELDRERSIPASTFEIPEGYQETQMLPMGEGSGGGEEEHGGANPFKMFNKGQG